MEQSMIPWWYLFKVNHKATLLTFFLTLNRLYLFFHHLANYCAKSTINTLKCLMALFFLLSSLLLSIVFFQWINTVIVLLEVVVRRCSLKKVWGMYNTFLLNTYGGCFCLLDIFFFSWHGQKHFRFLLFLVVRCNNDNEKQSDFREHSFSTYCNLVKNETLA